jgi:KaiC/GvpD/RAD55 family RecA-like ATPase
MPASIAGMGGDEALFVAANEVATQLGEDPAAIEGVLTDTFNPRCDPPWPAAKLRYEATRAASRQATPEARHRRRADERRAEADARGGPRIDANDAGDPWAQFASFTAPEEPIAYACEGLRLAPSKGKISVIAGQPGGGKGPIANHLAVCFALGLPAFGIHECRTSRVLLIDCEGSRLTMRRMRRMARGVGRDPADLEGRVLVVDASTIGDMTSDGNQDAIARIVEQHDIDVVILDSYTTAMLASGIESNSPQFALLAQMLGRLDRTVIAVAHANKASARDGEPRLSDIAYSGAFGALAQTAIVLHYPDDTDRHTIRVSCARAPETGFAPFDVRFVDVAETDALTVAVVVRPVTPATAAAPSVAKHRATVEAAARHADRVEALLRDADTLGAGMPPRKICDALGLRKADWCEARAEALRRGTIVEDTLPSDRSVTVRLAGRNEVELGGVLPAVGSVASTRKRRSG